MEYPQNQKQKTELTCDPAMPVMEIQLKEARYTPAILTHPCLQLPHPL